MRRSKRILVLNTLIFSLMIFTVSCFNNPTGTDEDNEEEPDQYSHTQNPGLSANDFLSNENYTDLVIEVDYMPGYAPNQQAIDSLQAFLERRLNKTTVTILEPTEVPSGDQSQYSASDVRDLESEHRSEFTEGETLAAYMIIVDGEYEQQNVLGIAYYNTSNAFFGPAYDQASSGFGAPSRYQVEPTSLRHKFGHLFGLVNIDGSGTDMQTDHQDEQNGHHCDNENCLMYYAMERPDLISQFFDDSVAELDANCIADLQANGGK
ncbi:peptidase [Gracilimonas halophila]|uniref:Peptidase n=1 Tax=Gracilimonas halophila TaxID=1834464 RepID=A0ABW5JFL8_9BACT